MPPRIVGEGNTQNLTIIRNGSRKVLKVGVGLGTPLPKGILDNGPPLRQAVRAWEIFVLDLTNTPTGIPDFPEGSDPKWSRRGETRTLRADFPKALEKGCDFPCGRIA